MNTAARQWMFWCSVGLLALAVGVGLWQGAAYFFALEDRETQSTHAQFGDFISGIAGGLGLLGMVLALLLQTRELGLQRKELQATKEIMIQQREESEQQTKASQAQADAMREMATAMKKQAEHFETQIELQREAAAAPYTARVQWRWRQGKNAELFLKNHGGAEAEIRLVGFKSAPGGEPEGTTYEQLKAFIQTRMNEHGAQIEVLLDGNLQQGAKALRLGHNNEQRVVVIAPQRFPVPAAAVRSLHGIQVMFTILSPSGERSDLVADLDSVSTEWIPTRS